MSISVLSSSLPAQFLALVCAALIAFGSLPLRAETNESDREKARALAAEGYDALQRKDYAVAEDRFRRADKLIHAPTLVVDWARALVGLGRLVEAHERYELVIREGVPDNSPWPWKRAFDDAQREIAQVRPRLAWVTVIVEGPERPVVFLDGRRVPSAAVGVPRAVNPGRRLVAVRARGFSSAQRALMLAEGQQLSTKIVLDPKPEGAEEEPLPAEVEVVDELPAPRLNQGGGLRRTAGYVAFTVGGVGLVVGGVTSALALKAGSDLSSTCPGGVCAPLNQSERSAYQQNISRYNVFRTASTVSVGVGLAGVAAGTYLLFFGKSSEAHVSRSGPRVTPVLGASSVGLAGWF